jgi:hypothetical protein
VDKHDGSSAAQCILLWPDFSYFGLIRPALIDFLTNESYFFFKVLVDDGNRGK